VQLDRPQIEKPAHVRAVHEPLDGLLVPLPDNRIARPRRPRRRHEIRNPQPLLVRDVAEKAPLAHPPTEPAGLALGDWVVAAIEEHLDAAAQGEKAIGPFKRIKPAPAPIYVPHLSNIL
jgi:hypothetical protein